MQTMVFEIGKSVIPMDSEPLPFMQGEARLAAWEVQLFAFCDGEFVELSVRNADVIIAAKCRDRCGAHCFLVAGDLESYRTSRREPVRLTTGDRERIRNLAAEELGY